MASKSNNNNINNNSNRLASGKSRTKSPASVSRERRPNTGVKVKEKEKVSDKNKKNVNNDGNKAKSNVDIKKSNQSPSATGGNSAKELTIKDKANTTASTINLISNENTNKDSIATATITSSNDKDNKSSTDNNIKTNKADICDDNKISLENSNIANEKLKEKDVNKTTTESNSNTDLVKHPESNSTTNTNKALPKPPPPPPQQQQQSSNTTNSNSEKLEKSNKKPEDIEKVDIVNETKNKAYDKKKNNLNTNSTASNDIAKISAIHSKNEDKLNDSKTENIDPNKQSQGSNVKVDTNKTKNVVGSGTNEKNNVEKLGILKKTDSSNSVISKLSVGKKINSENEDKKSNTVKEQPKEKSNNSSEVKNDMENKRIQDEVKNKPKEDAKSVSIDNKTDKKTENVEKKPQVKNVKKIDGNIKDDDKSNITVTSNSSSVKKSEDKDKKNKVGEKSEENKKQTENIINTEQQFPKALELALKGSWHELDQYLRSAPNPLPDVDFQETDNHSTALIQAVKENKIVIAERLMELGADVNKQEKDLKNALHYAASFCKDDMVRALLNRKADANCRGGPKDQLPLHMACSRSIGVVAIVQLLLKGASKESRLLQDKDNAIPIILSSEAGNVSVCRELLLAYAPEQLSATTKDGDTPLHIACRKKDPDLVKACVENGSQLDVQNKDGHSPLHLASWQGDENIVKYLVQYKPNANLTDEFHRTPLHLAAENGHTAIVDVLIDKFKADINARTKDGSTLMHLASQFGHPDTAMAFLRKGVPLHMPNKEGALCLHAAAKKGHVSVVKALLNKGAPVDSMTKDKYTALHVAVDNCKPIIVQLLLGYGAQVEIKGGKKKETPLHIASRVPNGEKCAEFLIKSGADVNSTQENGETALHISARHNQLKMCLALLDEGADPSWQSKAGETPLHIAVRYCCWPVANALLKFVENKKSRFDAVMLVNAQNSEGETAVHYSAEIRPEQLHRQFEDVDMIKTLLEYDGDTNIHTKLTQETSMHYCARAGNHDVLMEIVKHIPPSKVQIAVNKQAKNGWSPLLVASENGHLEILKILLKNHARVDVFDEHGKAALHLAAEHGHDKVADVLLQHKAFVNAKSKLGITPLHLAAQNGFNSLVKILIVNHSATIDALSLAKTTPLHMAAQNGQIEVCNTLLKMKADATASDIKGQTPLHLAAENDHSSIVKLFLKHRPDMVGMANTDSNGMTCAHIAASKGSVAVIKELMKFNKNVVISARNRISDSTTLHLAAAGGHAGVVKVLMDAGASPSDENNEGMTAIHLAGKYGHANVLDVLITKMSVKTPSNKSGLTALHVAAHYGQVDFVREILTKLPATLKSESKDSSDSQINESGYTPLHLASQSGHEGLVRMLLNSPGVIADTPTNLHGSIPLHLAAQSGHTSVVSLLLSKSTNQLHIKDKKGRTALQLASANGHINMVSLLLGQGADINSFDKNGWTALHFSSKAGHLNVVKLLTESGAGSTYETKDGKIPLCYAASNNHSDVLSYLLKKEHNSQNLMEDNKFVFDLMVVGKLNGNKSVQEFILVSDAPVDTAVKLSRNFRVLAIKEKERAKDLLAVGDFCESMATELNAIAANISSAGLVLKAVDERGVPFLDVLIECEQKEVMSHAAVQKHLTEIWMGKLSEWSGLKMLLLFASILLLPPVWLLFSLPIRNSLNRIPIVKFMCYLVSHIYMIILFYVVAVNPLIPIWESSSLIPHWHEWLLLAWLSGLLVSELTNPGDRAGLGWIRVLIIGICSIGVAVHVLGLAFSGNERLQCIYARNQFLAFSLLLCFVQLLDFLSFHHLFGPWAIIIRDLMKDLTKFLVILLIFMMGFTLLMSAIYTPVTAKPDPSALLGDGTGSGGANTDSVFKTFEILFFALFGLVDPENLPPIHRNPIWTITLAKAVFGVYLIVTIIVLINLLIAMMSDTYQRIQAQSDTEWKFGRAKLFRNMNKTSATPTPLNLVTKLFTYCRVLCKHKSKICSSTAQQYIDEEENVDGSGDMQSHDLLHGGHGGQNSNWAMRRNTQVAPEGTTFIQNANRGNGPMKIEDVVDWKLVGRKYLALQGDGREDDDEDSSSMQTTSTIVDEKETRGSNVA